MVTEQLQGASVATQANVFFDGKCVSHTVILANGEKKSVGVVLAATLPYFHLPLAGIPLVLAVDHIMDMGRSATNVFGNAVASLVVSRWEGERARPESV